MAWFLATVISHPDGSDGSGPSGQHLRELGRAGHRTLDARLADQKA
jgi:hypothetical protein